MPLPEFLYHFTSVGHYLEIVESGFIKLSPSNLLPPDEKTAFIRSLPNGGKEYWDKNSDYKPVVWLTDLKNPDPSALALYPEKCKIRLTIKNCFMYEKWIDFANRNSMDKEWRRSIERGRRPEHWFISQSQIPYSAIVAAHEISFQKTP